MAANGLGADKGAPKKEWFPTRSFHGSLIALVLALAAFRFFIQGAQSSPGMFAICYARWTRAGDVIWYCTTATGGGK